MYAFDYERPSELAGALSALQNGAQALAGGQTLIASLKQRLAQPEKLVDLGQIASLQGIRQEQGAVVIGAMTCHQVVADNAEVQQAIPSLADLAGHIGDRQVRAMGTLGGSIANNDPAACYPSAVLGLGASVKTNLRTIAADDFFQEIYTTALEEAELIESVSFPIPQRAAYAKFLQPASRFALLGVFVAQTTTGVRVAVTGAGHGVFRHTGLEAALDKEFSAAAVARVSVDASKCSSDLHASAEYRAQLIKVQTEVAVAQAR